MSSRTKGFFSLSEKAAALALLRPLRGPAVFLARREKERRACKGKGGGEMRSGKRERAKNLKFTLASVLPPPRYLHYSVVVSRFGASFVYSVVHYPIVGAMLSLPGRRDLSRPRKKNILRAKCKVPMFFFFSTIKNIHALSIIRAVYGTTRDTFQTSLADSV